MLNTAPGVQLNATFAPHQSQPGPIGFLSQSGGLGIAIIEAAARLGVGLSSFVSVGNKADLSGNDFLQYWEQDPETRGGAAVPGVVRQPAQVLTRGPSVRPHQAGGGRQERAIRGRGAGAASHTGALLAASDVTVDALFRQAGVIRTDTLGGDVRRGRAAVQQPVPRGDRVAVVTNAGGPGIICADACQTAGVQVPEVSPEVAARLPNSCPRRPRSPTPST